VPETPGGLIGFAGKAAAVTQPEYEGEGEVHGDQIGHENQILPEFLDWHVSDEFPRGEIYSVTRRRACDFTNSWRP